MTHKADVIGDVTKQVFFGSAYANDHLRLKVWFDHDRKDMENLLVHKLKKMLIFDQKILEFSNMNQRKFIDYESESRTWSSLYFRVEVLVLLKVIFV